MDNFGKQELKILDTKLDKTVKREFDDFPCIFNNSASFSNGELVYVFYFILNYQNNLC